MTTQRNKTGKTSTFTGKVKGRWPDRKAVRVMRDLDLLMTGSRSHEHNIEEQLKQCPEAFKAGELLERALSSLKYSQDEVSQDEPWLPPAGAVIPPIV